MAKKNTSNSILIIDSANQNNGYLLDQNKKLSLVKSGEFGSALKNIKLQNLKVASYLPISGKNVDNTPYNSIYYPMQIVKNEEDPEEFIMSKLYSEYADKMDSSKEDNYMVKFIPTQSASPNHIDYDILVYFDEDTRTKFSTCIDEVSYIDAIYPEPFLYKALYAKNSLKPIGVDCFLYIDKERVTITIYRAGEYLAYYENLQLKLVNLSRQLSVETRENISETIFVEKLMSEGLNYSYHDPNTLTDKKFLDLFKAYFDGHTSLFVMIDKLCKRKNINNINNIIVNSCYGTIQGFSERLKLNYRDTEVIDFKDLDLNLTVNNLNEFYRSKVVVDNKQDKISSQANDAMEGIKPVTFDLDINMFSVLSLLWIQSNEDMDDYVDVNVTLFSRPPKFLKRRSGQIITISVATFLAALIFPIGSMIFNSYFTSETDKNNNEIRERTNLIETSKSRIKNEEDKLTQARNDLRQSENSLNFEKNLINEIDNKKNRYLIKSICLSSISHLLSENKITVKQLEYREQGASKSVFLKVHAFDDNITTVVKELVEQGYEVENRRIQRIGNDLKKHESSITIKIKDNVCK